MAIDVLILNTAVADFRSSEFAFTEKLVGPGGLAKCKTCYMPGYTQYQYKEWIAKGHATAGGPGNMAPLLAKAGLKVSVGVCLGKGTEDGLDVQGRFFYDTLNLNGVDMSQVYIHPALPTGTTFVYDKGSNERGGIAYFPNANNDFDFKLFERSVDSLKPKIVLYMYSGLSDRGDANGGKDLASFMAKCRQAGSLTIVDSHTLTGDPRKVLEAKADVPHYRLLEPLLGEVDMFFASFDEARMIENTLGQKGCYLDQSEKMYTSHFLKFLADRFWQKNSYSKLFGVTVLDGAFVLYRDARGNLTGPVKVTSRFMCGNVVDLVGAGDSFRAGLLAYISMHSDEFKTSKINVEEAVQMGNLFASLYIKSTLNKRYENIGPFRKMLDVVQSKIVFDNFDELAFAVR